MRAFAVLLVALLCIGGTTAAVAAKPKKRKPPVPAAGLWKGERLDDGLDLRFRVSAGRARIGRVTANVLEDCGKQEPPTTTTLTSRGGWRVRRGRFSGRRVQRAGRVVSVVSIAGQFTSRTRASGVLRQRTTVAGVTCETERLPFVAHAARSASRR